MKNIGPALAGSAGPVPPPLCCTNRKYKSSIVMGCDHVADMTM